MATGQNLFSDISSFVNDIQEGSLMTLRDVAFVSRTVSVFSGQGMAPRKVYTWGAGNFRSVGEADDVTSTVVSKSLLNTLTPARYADMYFVSDQLEASDWDNTRAVYSQEMGGGAAESVETNICSNFSSLTGGTVGTAGGTLTWTNIQAAIANLRQDKVSGPLFCTLGHGQWHHLRNDVTVDASAFASSDVTATGFIQNYFTAPLFGGVVFVVTPHIAGAAGTAGYGAVYSPQALALDIRKPFNIRPERDESREGWELNCSMWYAHGVWAPLRGVQLVGTDVIA